jgi:hypothetical protein
MDINRSYKVGDTFYSARVLDRDSSVEEIDEVIPFETLKRYSDPDSVYVVISHNHTGKHLVSYVPVPKSRLQEVLDNVKEVLLEQAFFEYCVVLRDIKEDLCKQTEIL